MRTGLVASAFLAPAFFIATVCTAGAIVFDVKAYDKLARASGDDGGSEPIVYVEDRTPDHLLHRIVVEGVSAEDWTEALELLDLNPKSQPPTPSEYFNVFREHGDRSCPSEWTLLEEVATSVTFERVSGSCGPHAPQHALYKVIYRPGDVWVVIGTRKGRMDDFTRAAWLAVLASATVDDSAGAPRSGTAVADAAIVEKITRSINLSETATALANESRCVPSIVGAQVSPDSKPESGRWTEYWEVDRCGQETVRYRVELTTDDRGRPKYKTRQVEQD